VARFLGLIGFYRRFVRHYATLAAPLTDLLRSTKFSWSTDATRAFTELKNKITTVPILALPDFSKLFVVETDASSVAIGAVLTQDGHPLAFFSKKMCPRMQGTSVYVREMYAVTESVKKWRQYLIGRHFHIYTDQKSLKNVLTQKIQTPEQQKWATKLQGFSFEIFNKPGKSNQVADALSRKYMDEATLLIATSSTVPAVLKRLQHYYETEDAGQKLITKTQSDNQCKGLFNFKNGLLYFKNRLYIPDIPELREAFLREYHSTPTSGHSGTKATLARIASSFYWPTISKDTKLFVHKCSNCQHNKYLTKKKGLLQPLPIPNQVWEELTMDFITHLPNFHGHTAIWVICDRLTKYVHFLALPTHYTATDLANRFSVEICRLHGIPKSITSDRDPIFLSSFWKELFRVQGTSLRYSTAYHPETDGQTEVVNRCLEAYLRCFASDRPRTWYKFLHLAEFWHNSSFHSAIQMTPFQALYGRPPPGIPDYVPGSTIIGSLDSTLQQQQQILQLLKINLKASRQSMQDKANKKRSECTFDTGDWVLLRLRPYRQQTVHRRNSQKLAKRYFGPFKVRRRIGAVAYALELPASSRIHPVFHVSLLRKYHGEDPQSHYTTLPSTLSNYFSEGKDLAPTSEEESNAPSKEDTERKTGEELKVGFNHTTSSTESTRENLNTTLSPIYQTHSPPLDPNESSRSAQTVSGPSIQKGPLAPPFLDDHTAVSNNKEFTPQRATQQHPSVPEVTPTLSQADHALPTILPNSQDTGPTFSTNAPSHTLAGPHSTNPLDSHPPNNLNLEDKVPLDPQSIDMNRPRNIKKPFWLKDFITM
jgi:hypothetical protein